MRSKLKNYINNFKGIVPSDFIYKNREQKKYKIELYYIFILIFTSSVKNYEIY